MKRLDVSLASHRPADRGAATEPNNPDCAIERVAAADFVECGGVLLGAASGNTRRMKGEVAHRHADAENAGWHFRRLILKIHAWTRYVRSSPNTVEQADRTRSIGQADVGSLLCAGVAVAMQPLPDQMMSNGERMRGKQAIGVLAL